MNSWVEMWQEMRGERERGNDIQQRSGSCTWTCFPLLSLMSICELTFHSNVCLSTNTFVIDIFWAQWKPNLPESKVEHLHTLSVKVNSLRQDPVPVNWATVQVFKKFSSFAELSCAKPDFYLKRRWTALQHNCKRWDCSGT